MASKQVNITLTSAQLYWIYLFLFLGDLVAAFVAKIVPTDWGIAGVSPIAIAFLGTLADDYTSTQTPNGVPTWVTYLVMTVVMAVASTVGYFSADTLLTEVSVIAWLILVLGAIAQDEADIAANVPPYVDSVIQAVVGVSISFLTWLSNDPTATWGAILATLIGVLASYFHVTATAGTKAARLRAAGSVPPAPIE